MTEPLMCPTIADLLTASTMVTGGVHMKALNERTEAVESVLMGVVPCEGWTDVRSLLVHMDDLEIDAIQLPDVLSPALWYNQKPSWEVLEIWILSGYQVTVVTDEEVKSDRSKTKWGRIIRELGYFPDWVTVEFTTQSDYLFNLNEAEVVDYDLTEAVIGDKAL